MSFQDRIVESFIQHAPLICGLAVLFWYGFPMMLKKTLLNGGGLIVEGIVDRANTRQSEKNRHAIAEALAVHEEVEADRLQAALALVRAEEDGKGRACSATIHGELAALAARVTRLEGAG